MSRPQDNNDEKGHMRQPNIWNLSSIILTKKNNNNNNNNKTSFDIYTFPYSCL